ncbi:hypothetical protein B0H16DRAFT_1709569 [Mycena metata]|uniref:SNF5-domain-containing protein n=1 Tax=Mycena metata TaxID=1033252 RepID=A0AAD7KCD8_9AGAR|nr:hypothetical protein B0H16DRAFT_1709569 [Mycena metata]
MNNNGGGAYPPFAHQGINPAMLASYNQPQQQQPSQYTGGGQQQQHNQQQMALNPSALSAAANAGMAGGGGGGMNSFGNGGGPGPAHMNPPMQHQQLQGVSPQILQFIVNAGISREQFLAMSPAERQAAMRSAVMNMREQQQQQLQNRQPQQQQFMSDSGSYNVPGSGMGIGSPVGMGLGGGEYPPQPPPPQNGFPKHAPPQFGPGPTFGSGMPPQQQQPNIQQNAPQNSFGAPGSPSFGMPGPPYNRPMQRLPPVDTQPQVLRSNSMGPPPPMMRPSSSGPEMNGYPHSNGATPQPQRAPSFGPHPPMPQRHSSISRSMSPIRRAPSTPTHPEAIPAIPSIPPPATLPPPPPTPGPILSAASSLPPLPVSVNLNPAITRVTVVPLATSLTDIPPVSADEVEAVKEWMQVDKKYDGVYREMKTRMSTELRDVMGPRSVPWWEKGALSSNASRFLHGNEQFDVRYPYRKRDWERERKKPPKREGLKLPRKLDPEDANRPEELVPIRLEFDVEHHKIRDTFVWDMNACVVSPEHFAQTVVEDYNLAPIYHGVIVKSIQDQLSDYRAHSAHYEGDSWDVLKSADSQNNNTGAGTLEGESAEWWCNWRKRLRTEYGSVRKERLEKRKRRKVVKDEETENEQPMTVEDFDFNEKGVHEDMRILIRVSFLLLYGFRSYLRLRLALSWTVIVGSIKLDDQFEWDLDNAEASPENFAEIYTQELGLGGEFRTAIVHAIREQDDDLRQFVPSQLVHRGARDGPATGNWSATRRSATRNLTSAERRIEAGAAGVPLPEREPIRTYRTPAIGFPEPDPAVVAAVAAATAPMSRRAAAAAASVTIANLVASENGDRGFMPSSLPALPAPPPLILKEKTTKGFFKPPPYDPLVLRPRAKIPAPIPSSAVDVSTLPPPLEDDPPPPPTSSRARAAPVSMSDNRTPRTLNLKRGKGNERLAKEREFADGQQQNMINGVWHCSNCGCPESIAVGRRKGPLGDKSQCGTCGKYWHRYRKPRPVEYNSDYDHHAAGLKREADLARRRKGRPPLSAATPLDISEPPTPRDTEEGTSRQSPLRDVSPVSTESSASEMPLAQRIKINHTPSTPPPPPPASAPVSVVAPPTPAPAPAPQPSPVVEPASIPLQFRVSLRRLRLNRLRLPRRLLPLLPLHQVVPLGPRPVEPPLWLQNAMTAMQLQPDYTNDRYEAVVKANAREWEWRLKCLDCPGKIYITGPGETLNNYELHLKNRLHRQRVNERIRNSTLS